MKTLKEILGTIDHTLLGGEESVSVPGLSFDSRAVPAGGAFIAIEGSAADGHDYIDKAIKEVRLWWCCAKNRTIFAPE